MKGFASLGKGKGCIPSPTHPFPETNMSTKKTLLFHCSKIKYTETTF